jgi:hypothetical protein
VRLIRFSVRLSVEPNPSRPSPVQTASSDPPGLLFVCSRNRDAKFHGQGSPRRFSATGTMRRAEASFHHVIRRAGNSDQRNVPAQVFALPRCGPLLTPDFRCSFSSGKTDSVPRRFFLVTAPLVGRFDGFGHIHPEMPMGAKVQGGWRLRNRARGVVDSWLICRWAISK